jgi:hypothetical protein
MSAGRGYSQDANADLPYTPTETASDNSICKFVNNYISCWVMMRLGKNDVILV